MSRSMIVSMREGKRGNGCSVIRLIGSSDGRQRGGSECE